MKPVLFKCLLISFCLFSCEKNAEKQIISYWVVEELKFNDHVVTEMLISTGLSFMKTGECFLPVITKEPSNKDRWKYEKIDNQDFIIINSPNSPLKGKYKIFFHNRSGGKEVILELESPTVYIKAATLSAMIK